MFILNLETTEKTLIINTLETAVTMIDKIVKLKLERANQIKFDQMIHAIFRKFGYKRRVYDYVLRL